MAHESGLSYLDVRVEPGQVKAALDAPVEDFGRALRLDADGNGILSAEDITAAEASLRRWYFAGLRFVANGRPCDGERITATLREDALLTVEGIWRCEGDGQRLYVASRLLDTFGDGHSTFVRATRGEVSRQVLLNNDTSSADLDFAGESGALETFGRFLVLGVEHIFTGIDHVLFLVALLLLGGSFRRIVGIATAFTAAHSVTLSLAALQVVTLPSQLVESVIAASIGWVAIENWVYAPPRAAEAPEPFVLRWRWLLTFMFGLVHGFGFASVLADLGLPKGNVPLALGAFNVGVELGQITIIAVSYPLLQRAMRTHWYRPRAVQLASLALFGVAVYWFVQRAFPVS